MNLEEALYYSNNFFECNGIDEAEFKALCIVCNIAGIKNSQYQQNKDKDILMKKLADDLWKVKSGTPLQYVIGKWDFYNSTFFVGEGVLIPRPETEELVDYAVKYLKTVENPIVYDLCSGTGAIGVSIAKEIKSAKVFAIEKSTKAFEYLKKNANGVSNIELINGDIYDDFDLPMADLIVSNPPYIPTDEIDLLQEEVKKEPKMALDGGCDGLDFYRLIISKWSSKIKPQGKLLLEIGENQGNALKSMTVFDYKSTEVIKDLSDNDRILCANKS